MSIWDDSEPRKKRTAYELGADLSSWSVGELDEYLEALAVERTRVETAKAAKKASQNAANSVFKL